MTIAALGLASGPVRDIAVSITRRLLPASSLRAPQRVSAVRPVLLGLEQQWAKLAGVVLGAIGRAQDAKGFHSAAAQQLDLAQYALANLIDELAGVMAIPAYAGKPRLRVVEGRANELVATLKAA